MPSRADYAACAALGLTKAETGRRLGVDRSTVGNAARRDGLTFVTGRRMPQSPEHRAAISDGVKHAIAEGRAPARMRKIGMLSPKERDDYAVLMRTRSYRSAEAYQAIGRGDLA